jgi:hypothetical protein
LRATALETGLAAAGERLFRGKGPAMNARLATLPVVALLAAALLAGCGSSSSTTKSAAPATAPAAGATAPSTTGAPAATTPTAGGAQAVAACKQAIQAQTSLPASAKSKLEAVCGKAASGDQAAVRKVAQEVCEEVIKQSAVPAGPTREQALAACKRAGQ